MVKLISKDYLQRHMENIKEYAHYSKQLKKLNNQSLNISGERLCKECERLRHEIITTQQAIKVQIQKVKKPVYRNILTMRYIYQYKWSRIIEILFSDQDDYEYQKEERYKDKTLLWHRSALKELARTNDDERTAVSKLKKIKKLCLNISKAQGSYEDFFLNVNALVV